MEGVLFFLCSHTSRYNENLRGGAEFGRGCREGWLDIGVYCKLLRCVKLFSKPNRNAAVGRLRVPCKGGKKQIDLLTLILLFHIYIYVYIYVFAHTHLFTFIFPFELWFSNKKFLTSFLFAYCYHLERSLWHVYAS
jgi:hypothetical protein